MEITYKDNAVHIVIPCGPEDIKNAPLSKSGNSRVIGGTGGFAVVNGAPPGVRVAVNLITKP
jgi:hypothetical protein